MTITLKLTPAVRDRLARLSRYLQGHLDSCVCNGIILDFASYSDFQDALNAVQLAKEGHPEAVLYASEIEHELLSNDITRPYLEAA